MITGLIDDIIAYIEYLKGIGLDITIHESDAYLFEYMYDFSKYNIHGNPFCVAVKSNNDAWEHCIKCQEKIYKKLKDGPFWGMCYAGAEEYVFPFENRGEICGFISVGSYGIDEKSAFLRINKISEEYFMDCKALKDLYRKSLKHEKPQTEYIKTLIKPLVHMLGYFAEHIPVPLEYSLSNDKNTLYSRIMAYINRNFCNRITLSDIAKECCCSVSAVSHTFKKYSGCSVNNYIITMRMIKAKVLLLSSGFPIRDISEMTGFSDSNYFTNTFRNFYGISPGKYRKIQ